MSSDNSETGTETDPADPTAHWSFETKQVHAGQQPDPATNARALPIYQTTSYVFDDTAHAAALFGLEVPGNIYTRIGNPTTDVVEQRVAALEGGVAALFLSSGQAAETFAILNLACAGDHIVSSPRLYGGTYNLFHYSLAKLGIEVSFVADPDDLDSWQAAVRPNTKAFFAETISNPQIDVLDTPGVAGVAHANGIPLIVDNTIATPYLIQPFTQGADIVIHSATKYLGGHGSAIAGVIVDGGTFDWTQGRFPGFTTPDPSYHGVVYAELGPPAYALKARVQLLRDLGSAASPFNAFLVAQGLETLSLRMERHVANAQRVAEFVAAHEGVLSVNYAGLPSSPWYELGKKLAPKGTGAVLAFELAGGADAGKAFVNALKLHSHVANAQRVAEFVAAHEGVLSVNYAGLPSSPWYELGKQLAPKGTGAVLAFELAGGIDAGKAFVNALRLHSHVANIGDVRSLVIHPASTTHAQLSPEEQLTTGVSPGLVRLAVGIEGIDDILADLELGFAAARKFSGDSHSVAAF